MRFLLLLFVGAGLLGCAKIKATKAAAAKPETTAAPAADSKPVVTLDETVTGKVLHVNRDSRFVVLNFVDGRVPPARRLLNVYRDGLKVGEVRITGPQEGYNTVADVVTGELRKNDEAREQ